MTMSNNDKMLNDAIQKHRDLREYYDAMGCKDDVTIQERYIVWLTELQEYRADVQEVRHGRWIKAIGDDYECSICKAAVWARKANPISEYKYCWRCGARMDGDNNEQS